MPETNSKGTTGSTRMNIAHMATSLYAERVTEDTKLGEADLYTRNPEARQMYFKGVHDVLTCLDVWLKAGVPPARLAEFMDELHAQSGPLATGRSN